MKKKTILALTLVLLALGTSGSTPIAPKNYYQFGLGVWVFEPFHSQVFTMSYERVINSKFAIGGSFSYQIEEYTMRDDIQTNIPNHDFIYGTAFSHPHLLSDDITAPGMIYFNGSTYKLEESFGGIHVSYTLFRKPKSFADIALGAGAKIYSFQYHSIEEFDFIRIHTDTVLGKSRAPHFEREIAIAGFFRARYSYQIFNNVYLGSSLVLPYVYAYGFPLKITFNVGVRF